MSHRFVILEHDHPMLHWDLMLEAGDILRTFRMPLPPNTPAMTIEPIADHRLAYLDHEGPISGNRGSVKRVDRGTYTITNSSDASVRYVLTGDHVSAEVIVTNSSATWVATEPQRGERA